MKKVDYGNFPASSYEEWELQVLKELDGRSFETLRWHNENGFVLDPCYPGVSPGSLAAGQYNRRRIHLHQQVTGSNAGAVNAAILRSLAGGVDSIGIKYLPVDLAELEQVLAGVQTELIDISFISENSDTTDVASLMNQLMEKRGGDAKWKGNRKLRISSLKLHNEGVTAVSEIVNAMLMGNELLREASTGKIYLQPVLKQMQFDFGIGASFFVEIAKFLAFRKLWDHLVRKYDESAEPVVHVFAQTSSYHQSVTEPYNNLLRTTTQSISAILGGVDTLSVTPYTPGESNEQSLRLARNIYHLLAEESFLTHVDPDHLRSSYISEITNQLITKSWEKFVQISSDHNWKQLWQYELMQVRNQ